MAISDTILSLVASEQGFLASILSSEAVKIDRSARWITLVSDISVVSEDFNTLLSKSIALEGSASSLIRATADKEIAIAAKVAAVLGNKMGPITWVTCCPTTSADC